MELEDTPIPRSPSKQPPPHASSWSSKYFGDVIVKGFALASSSSFVKLKTGDPVTLVRVKPSPVEMQGAKKKNSAALKKLENDVVR